MLSLLSRGSARALWLSGPFEGGRQLGQSDRVPEAIALLLRRVVSAAAREGAVVSFTAVVEEIRARYPGEHLPPLLLKTALVREASQKGIAVQFDAVCGAASKS